MRHFCTYFDHNYLSRGLTLYLSLKRHTPDVVLHVLALSDECESVLGKLALPDMKVVSLAALEAFDPELAECKRQRPWVEYYFTLSPCWPRYLLTSSPDVELLTYVDADCAIFSDPSPVLAEMSGHSVGMVGHRFPARLRHLEECGVYNVGWLSFRNDEEGNACLNWWRDRCLEWCEDRVEAGRYADQKYLDLWPTLFPHAHEFSHPGVNVAPWNAECHAWTTRNGTVLVDDAPLVCYHFHSLRRLLWRFWSMGFAPYDAVPDKTLCQAVYLPYARDLEQQEKKLGSLFSSASPLRNQGSAGFWRGVRRARRAARQHDLLIDW